jgi:hypothetical protein
MSSMDHQYFGASRESNSFDAPPPPVSVLIQLAGLVWVLAVEVAKSYLASLFNNTSERLSAYPRAGTATMLRANVDRNKKE